jgi:hypothetical protein
LLEGATLKNFKIYDNSKEWQMLIPAESPQEAAVVWAQSRLWRSKHAHRIDHILVENEERVYKIQVLQLIHVEIEAVLTSYTCGTAGQRDVVILENSANSAAFQFMQRLAEWRLIVQGSTLEVKVSSKSETTTFQCTCLRMDPNGYVDAHIEELPCQN